MKKIILTLLTFPMFLVSCAEKGDDSNIQGMWTGEVKVSDIQALQGINREMLAFNDRLATETFVFKFDDRNIEIYRSKNSDSLDNKVEVEFGNYRAEDNALDISITSLSCATNDGKNFGKKIQTKRNATYRVADNLTEMTINFGVNKKITLTKLEGQDELDMENAIDQSVSGCFVNGKFEKNKPQKPTQEVDLEGKLEEVKQEEEAAE